MRLRLAAVLAVLMVGADVRAQLVVHPVSVALDNPEATAQLLASKPLPDGRSLDRTRAVAWASADPRVVRVDATGLLTPVADGTTEVIATVDGQSAKTVVTVSGIADPKPIAFETQVISILTKNRCNSGGCHGKAEGQNGFKLSVFGFDTRGDFQALVSESRGRRIFPASPDASLLLTKGTGLAPHGGGRKIDPGSLAYQRLRRWIAEGGRYVPAESAAIVSVTAEPAAVILDLKGSQQLRVVATDAAGRKIDVTAEAEYESNATTVADADRHGFVQASDVPGEAAILVRYLGHVAICRVTVPRPGVVFARPAEANFIDKHVWDKLARLGVPPSSPAVDAMFLRRAFLDIIGTLPTPAETRAFLTDTAPDKRSQLVDALLDRPEYADYWAMKWSDLLRVDKDAVTPQGAVAVLRWLRKQFAENRPYDVWVREVLTARGNTTAEGPAAFYKVLNTPEVLGRSVSQLFLGVRIECAQCHHHPSERWGQDDYFAWSGLFSGVKPKPVPGGGQAIIVTAATDLKHPRTGKPVRAAALGEAPLDPVRATGDRRKAAADWLTEPENPYFARALANRLWAHYFGRGLVEPIDDLRATNPASNEPLLDALADHLRAQNYDLKAFTRTLLRSNAYQLSSQSTPENATDQQNFSHMTTKALPAEVLLDAICQVTGVPEKFSGWPAGYRAIQVWDNRLPSYFFRIFGRPVRASVCECERGNEPSIAQALHLMNSPEIGAKLRDRAGTARKLAESELTTDEIVEELSLACLARRPTDRERDALKTAFTGVDRRTAVEDVLWALLNTKEFLYNR